MQETKPRRRQDLEDRLIGFAARVLDVAAALPKSPVGRHLAEQLTRCGTSPMANYAEAQGAESRKDFVPQIEGGLEGTSRDPRLAETDPAPGTGRASAEAIADCSGVRRTDCDVCGQRQDRPGRGSSPAGPRDAVISDFAAPCSAL